MLVKWNFLLCTVKIPVGKCWEKNQTLGMCDFSWASNFVGLFSFCFFRTKCFCFDSVLEGDVDYEEADFEEIKAQLAAVVI